MLTEMLIDPRRSLGGNIAIALCGIAAVYFAVSFVADKLKPTVPSYVTSAGLPADAFAVATRLNYDGATDAFNYAGFKNADAATVIADAARPTCAALNGNIDKASIGTPERVAYYPGGFDAANVNPPPRGLRVRMATVPLDRATLAVVPCEQVARTVFIPVSIGIAQWKSWTLRDRSDLSIDPGDYGTPADLSEKYISTVQADREQSEDSDEDHLGLRYIINCSKLDFAALEPKTQRTAQATR